MDGDNLQKFLKSKSNVSIPIVRVRQAEKVQNLDKIVDDVKMFFEDIRVKVEKFWCDLIHN